MAAHEMWRDELQAWLLARDSATLGELWRNTRYEGHPLLWHLALFVLARLGAGPGAMQLLHWALATAAAAFLLHRSALPLPVRLAVVFSYLPFFEYGVISRNYAATVVGLLAFARCLQTQRPLGAAGAAALAANASPMGMVLAPALALGMWLRQPRRAALPLLIIAVALAAAVAQCLPPPDYEHARGWHLGWEAERAGYTARNFAAALLPLPKNHLHFWNSSALFRTGPHPFRWRDTGDVLALSTIAGFVAGVAWLVWRSRPARWVWLAGSGSLLAFAYLKFPGALRHAGFLWVLAVVAVWIAGTDARFDSRPAKLAVAAALAVADLGTAVAVRWELGEAFSGARCAALRLEREGLDRLPLVAGCDFSASGVVAYLPGRTLLFPATGSRGSFVVWNLARLAQDTLHEEALVDAAAALDAGRGAVLLHNRPLARLASRAAQCELVAACEPTIVADEAQWIYVCRDTAPGATPPTGTGGGGG